jgi:hypothetical protein
MSRYRYLRRTDLFLVRVWRDETGDHAADDGSGTGNGAGNGAGNGKTEWQGKLQRVVDGESHQFDSWQGLVELLLAMLTKNEGR